MNQDAEIDKKNLESKPEPKKENFLKEIVKFALLAIIIIVPIRTFVAEPFIVSGLSMYPTFNDGQYLIVDQLTYDFSKPQRGDVIIFRYPRDTSVYFIKRVIGLPGETVSIRDGVVNITKTITNSSGTTTTETFALSEPYISDAHRSYDNSEITLTNTQYFVMGDNRNQSADSRTWGPLEQNLIVGRPYVRLLPPNTISFIPGRDKLGNN